MELSSFSYCFCRYCLHLFPVIIVYLPNILHCSLYLTPCGSFNVVADRDQYQHFVSDSGNIHKWQVAKMSYFVLCKPLNTVSLFNWINVFAVLIRRGGPGRGNRLFLIECLLWNIQKIRMKMGESLRQPADRQSQSQYVHSLQGDLTECSSWPRNEPPCVVADMKMQPRPKWIDAHVQDIQSCSDLLKIFAREMCLRREAIMIYRTSKRFLLLAWVHIHIQGYVLCLWGEV